MSVATVTLLLATLGFLSPASRGALLTTTVMIYVLMSSIAGGAAVWLWGQVRGGWCSPAVWLLVNLTAAGMLHFVICNARI